MQLPVQRRLERRQNLPLLEIVTREDFPRVELTREPRTDAKLYGPFTAPRVAGSDSGLAENLQVPHSVRSTWKAGDEKYAGSVPACCTACNNARRPVFSDQKEDYRRDIQRLRLLLEGGKKRLLEEMRSEMLQASKNLNSNARPVWDEIRLLKRSTVPRGARHPRSRRCSISIRPRGWPAEEGAEAQGNAADARRGRHRPPGGRRNRGQPVQFIDGLPFKPG